VTADSANALTASAAGTSDPGVDGYSAKSYSFSTYLQTNPKQIGHTLFNYSTDFTIQQGQFTASAPDTGTVTTPVSNRTVDVRFFTQPLQLNKRTQVTDSLTVGQVWSTQNNHLAPVVSASLGLTRTFRKSDSLSLNYTYRYDPLLSQLGSPSTSLNPLEALLRSSTQQRITATYLTLPLPKLSISFAGGYGLPLGDRSLFASARYRINNDWGIGLTSSYEQYVVDSYRDLEYSVSHKVFGRDLAFYYSTKTKKVRFDFGRAALTSKVIDGSFPDYTRVIPRDNSRVMTVDNALFAEAVDRVATISSEKSRSVKLSVETGRVVLTVRNMETGQAVEELEVDYEGEPFEIGFNARYLLDVSAQIAGETAEFRFADRAAAATMLDPVLVLDPTDAGVQYVLMPLRA